MSSEKTGLMATPKIKKITVLEPPDGEWGWIIVAGIALTNVFNQSMLSMFGLLYGDALEAMGHTTQGAAVVLSTMLFFTNLGGPIAGAIINLTSTKFVAMIGACSCTLGIFFSAFSTTIIHLVITYGILLGLGLGFIQNSSFVTINSYFTLRKSRAVGLANAGTGVGQTLMPHFVGYMLTYYGFRGTCLILSGLSLHGICGTWLIQPVERHMKKMEKEVLEENLELLQEKHKNIVIRKNTQILKEAGLNINRRATEPELNGNDKSINWNQKSLSYKELNLLNNKSNFNGLNGNNNNGVVSPQKKPVLKKIYDLLDISLLSSPRFLNIIIGTALSVTSIQNFSMLYPFYLQKVAEMDKQETAICMSAVAVADILGRLILPIFQDKYKIKARWMLIGTCVWLIITRQILAYQTDLYVLVLLSCLYGFGRSMIIVARNIAISENCRLDQVPAAVGLGMLTMGIIVPPSGYLLGWIRDFTGSYIICITAQNALLAIVLATWIPDMLHIWMKERKQNIETVNQTEKA